MSLVILVAEFGSTKYHHRGECHSVVMFINTSNEKMLLPKVFRFVFIITVLLCQYKCTSRIAWASFQTTAIERVVLILLVEGLAFNL